MMTFDRHMSIMGNCTSFFGIDRTVIIAFAAFLMFLYAGRTPLHAQITIDRVSVFADYDESTEEVGTMAHVEVKWLIHPDTPPMYQMIRIHKYMRQTGVYEPVDSLTINQSPNNNWGDLLTHDYNAPELYWVDICDGSGVCPYVSFVHGTIFLNELSDDDIDPCVRSISMIWSNYQVLDYNNIPTDIPFTHNRIMVLPPGGTDEIVDVTLPFEETSYDLSFDHGPGVYRIRVRAVEIEQETGNVLRESNSNPRYIGFDRPVLDDLSITYVTVAENGDIDLAFSVLGDPGDISEFNFQVFRAMDIGQVPELLGDASWDPMQDMFLFKDESASQFDEGPLFYQVKAHITECEETIDYESGIVSSLYLDASIDRYIGLDPVIGFEWEQYPGGVSNFRLYRRLQNEPDSGAPIATDPFDVPDDDLSLLPQPVSGEVFYYVEADYNGYTITSNITSVVIERELEIPNAFRPLSEIPANQTFKPSLPGGFIPSEYRLTIYNRWGQEMFVVDNPGHGWAGWNGTDSDGREVQQGVYGFRLEYQIGSGPQEEVMGTVMLIR